MYFKVRFIKRLTIVDYIMVSDVVFFKKFETAFFRERLLLGHDTKTLAIVHVQNLTPT